MAYHRILLPTDGSPLANLAATDAIAIAQSFGASIVVVQVTDAAGQIATKLGLGHSVIEEVLPVALDTAEQRAREDVRHLAAELRSQVLVVDERVVHGLIGPTLLRVAHNEDCDLIVMCTHGRGGLERGKLGTVTDYVVRHSLVPVLVTHPTGI